LIFCTVGVSFASSTIVGGLGSAPLIKLFKTAALIPRLIAQLVIAGTGSAVETL
jgi:hypothetical protein